MTDSELEALLLAPESDLLEKKASFSDRNEVRKTVCAFANDMADHQRPGVILIGVRDDGSCAHLAVTDELLRNLAAMKDDGNILPLPSMTVQRRIVRGCDVAVVVVQPCLAPPVKLKGRTWIRVGPRNATASAEDELRLAERRRARDLPFDIRPLPSATLEDLDLQLFECEYLPRAVAPEVLAQNDRSTTDKLKALRFLDPSGRPTGLGVLVLGKDPRRHIPGDYVQFLRIDGAELTDAIRDEKQIDGPLAELLRRLEDVLKAHNAVAVSITESPTEVQRPEYPLPALEQLARNAVLHRAYDGTNAPVRVYWFSDRIEIHSPGGPFGEVNRQNFGQPNITDYRNPHLAAAMKVLGYVQQFGAGIPIARRELQRNGNPPAEFTVEATHVLATVRRHP
ncbi:MAG: putative DNA binding domain-containing protein [Planctomycetes bacterium]|nr:putative DNA binding domain-containing protein [Planctomycetota bacterium]